LSDGKGHWDAIYGRKTSDQLSWYRPHLDRSLELIRQARVAPDGAIIDVGGGTSTLVDDLLARGHTNVTVLDISPQAVAAARERLGPRAAAVRWILADITTVELPEATYDFWHDRAVFHFLHDEKARQRYVETARRALKPGGHIVVATFGPEGPQKCSGLDVVRYSAEGLHTEFGADFEKVSGTTESHRTPWGSEQQFVYCYCRLKAAAMKGRHQ
jgi:SAM-dependent methyltransferase